MKTRGYLTERGQFYASLTAMPKHERATAKPLVLAEDAREPKLRAAILAISQAALYSPHRGEGWDTNLDKLIQHHAVLELDAVLQRRRLGPGLQLRRPGLPRQGVRGAGSRRPLDSAQSLSTSILF